MQLTDPRLFQLVLAAAALVPLLAALPWWAGRHRRAVVARDGGATATGVPRGPGWRLVPRFLGRLLVIVLAQLLAIMAVFLWANDTYGFMASWQDLLGQEHAAAAPIAAAHPLPRVPVTRMRISRHNPHPNGTWQTLHLAQGADASFGQVRVWLPPQYFEPSRRDTRFPVLVAMDAEHGTGPEFASRLRGGHLAMRAILTGRATPFIAVYVGSRLQSQVDSECVDLPNGVPGQTWYARSLVDFVQHRFRTVKPGEGWFAMGWSTGGQCAAVLAAKYPRVFTAAVGVAPYMTPVFDDPSVVAGHPELVSGNSPLAMVKAHQLSSLRLLTISSKQDPQSWGDGGQTRLQGQVMGDVEDFEPLARELPGAAFMLLPDGGHHESTYQPCWPKALAWLGSQGL